MYEKDYKDHLKTSALSYFQKIFPVACFLCYEEKTLQERCKLREAGVPKNKGRKRWSIIASQKVPPTKHVKKTQ